MKKAWNDRNRPSEATGEIAAMLGKVRALLAKAESTTFDAEAEALTAKAQELMARYRIDRALLDATHPGPKARTEGRRIAVDDPYADPKAFLLARLAAANGCRSVWSKDERTATVFGFPDELDALEELYTSLLVQAAAALQRAGSKQDGYGRSRTRSFRRSFLVAFAVRIGERLRETVDATIEEVAATSGTALVPLLRAREEAVAQAAREAFPHTRSFAPTVSDGEGWHAGTVAANLADLSVSRRLDRRSA
jgi:hypothetical protein